MANPPAAARSLRRITVSGTPRERGRSYGSQARAEISRSIEGYRMAFGHYRGWSWAEAVRRAAAYAEAIEEFHPPSMEEIRGIAEGSGTDTEDILALNVRSELMFAGPDAPPSRRSRCCTECTSFAVLPPATRDRGYLAQNWDWLPFSERTTVLLEVCRPDGNPGYVTLVEAGLLAKSGHNSAGLALCTNTLVSARDTGQPGVPYHILLRALLDAKNLGDAVGVIMDAQKALSGNFMLAHADGLAINVEASAGGADAVRTQLPEQGILVHSNHFLHPDLAKLDAHLASSPNTLLRLYSASSRLQQQDLALNDVIAATTDHRNHPAGVCGHGNPNDPDAERYMTIGSVIYELATQSMFVAAGNPCTAQHTLVSTGGQLVPAASERVVA